MERFSIRKIPLLVLFCVLIITGLAHSFLPSHTLENREPVLVPLFKVDGDLWNRTLGGSHHDSGQSVVKLSTGGFAIGGTTASYSTGDTDFWLVRLDATGNVLWNQTYGTPNSEYCQAMIRCKDGGFAVMGIIGLSASVLLVRTNTNGDHLWNQTYTGERLDQGYSLVECTDGGFAITGSTGVDWANPDMWLIKTDQNGNLLWNYTYGGFDTDRGYGITETSNGDLVMVGNSESFSVGREDVWLVRTNATGYMLWNRSYGASSWDRGYSVLELADGNLIIMGKTESYGMGLSDVWLIKTDEEGNPIWQTTFGGPSNDEGFGIDLCSDGGFVIAGYTESFSVDLSDMWLVRTTHQGDLLWNFSVGTDKWEYSYSVVQTFEENFLIVGSIGDFAYSEKDLLFAHIPATPPDIPTIPTIPTQPIDLGLLFAIVFPVLMGGIVIGVGVNIWQRSRQKHK